MLIDPITVEYANTSHLTENIWFPTICKNWENSYHSLNEEIALGTDLVFFSTTLQRRVHNKFNNSDLVLNTLKEEVINSLTLS